MLRWISGRSPCGCRHATQLCCAEEPDHTKPRLAGAPFAGIGSFVKRIFSSDDPGTVEVDVENAPTEHFRVHEIVGDGRCMFRATVRLFAGGGSEL